MANGFTYNGIHSDSLGIIVNSVRIPATPSIENRLESLGGIEGAWDYGVSYGTKEIEVDVTLIGESPSETRKAIRTLTGAINPKFGSKPLIFDFDDDVQYFGRLGNQIPIEQIGMLGTFTLMFVCPEMPFTYSVDKESISGSGDFDVTHAGAYMAKPVITVIHDGGKGSIRNIRPDSVVETLEFKEDSPSGTYVIDSINSTMTVNGERAYNYISGDYFEFAMGSNWIQTNGIEHVTFEFYHTWL